MTRPGVLVLERNEKIRSTLKKALSKGDFEYHELSSNDQLFHFLNENPVSVILMNSSQQGTGNRTVCTVIRNDPQFRRFPLIILYGKPGKISRYDFMNQGADDFVPMPFSPGQLVDTIKARLRPLSDSELQKTTTGDKAFKRIKSHFVVSPLDKKGNLDSIPPAAIFAKLFAHKESGVLDLIINKETRTLYFKNGDLILAETMSKKDDISEFLAKNRAGSGSGKEIIAARIQSGGPKSDPKEFSDILHESKLIKTEDFSWWLRLHQIELIADLFIKPQGAYQWQSLDIPEYTKKTNLTPMYTPRLIFEGVRRIKKWWAYRDLLPENTSIPHLSPDFTQKAKDYGLTEREIAAMQIVDGKRNLRTIGEMCHIFFPQIENYIYTCRQLQMIGFDLTKSKDKDESIDLNEIIDVSEETLPDEGFNLELNDQVKTVESHTEQAESETAGTPIKTGTETEVFDHKPPDELPDTSNEKSIAHQTEGSLTDTHVSAVFRQCVAQKYTGETCFDNQTDQVSVFWKQGKIISAMSTNIQKRLDYFLLNKNLITEEQQKSLEEYVDNSYGVLNEVIKKGLLPINQVFAVVKDHVEQILFSLLGWQTGNFKHIPDKTPPKDTPPLELSAQNIIMNVMHASDISSFNQNKIPEPDCFFQLKGTPESLKGTTLTGLERRIINILNEPSRIDKITRLIDMPESEIITSLIALETAGIVERLKKP